MEKTKVNQLIAHERPFTTFVSARYLLDRFSRVEQNYLVSKYGLEDLTKVVRHLVVSKAIYFDNYPEGENSCKLPCCFEDYFLTSLLDTSESGEEIKIAKNKYGQMTVNDHRVVEKDILAANG
jgi:hypothetical protein